MRANDNKNPLKFKGDPLTCFQNFFPSLLLFVFVLVFFFKLPSPLFAKELPTPVSIKALAEDETRFDGHRIIVSGRVQSIFMQRGRLGSPYLKIILEENRPNNKTEILLVEVISTDFPKIKSGDDILVQGNYRISGERVGRIFPHYIDAEIIVYDIPEV